MIISISTFNEIIEAIEEHYDTILAEAAIQDKDGAITDDELDQMLADSD